MKETIQQFYRIIFIFFYCAISTNINSQHNQYDDSQQNKIDSLLFILKTSKEDSNKLNNYIKLFKDDYFHVKDIQKYHEQSLQLAELLIRKSNSEKLKKILLYKKANCFNQIGIYFWETKNSIKEQYYVESELSIYEQLKDTNSIVKLYLSQVGRNYNGKGYKKALSYYHKAVTLAKLSENRKLLAGCNVQFALMYMQAGDYKTPIPYLEEASKVYVTEKDTYNLDWTYSYLKKCHSISKDLQNALKYHKLLSLIYKKHNPDYSGYASLFIIYEQNGDYKNAIFYSKKNLKEFEKSKRDSTILSMGYSDISEIYVKMQQYDSALVYLKNAFALNKSYANDLAKVYFLKKDYNSARKYFKNNGYNELLAYRLDSVFGNYKGALIHHLKYLKIKEERNQAELLSQANHLKFQKAFDKQEEEQTKKEEQAKADKKRNKIILYSVICGLLLVIGFSTYVFKNLKILQNQNRIIVSQKQEVEKQKEIAEKQKHLVEEKQKEILDSITYAKRLQQAILPPTEFISQNLSENFILYKPKDIVAGDFYWADEIENKFFIAAADSTGHGVPGAMVSVVCSNALNRTIKEFKLAETGKILDKARELVLETFEKSSKEVKDGMDISLLCIDKKSNKIFWSGANNPLWFIENGELKEIKADKQPIGKTDNPKPFTTHEIEFKENLTFYLFTDGLADQFGGPKGKKFKYKQFEEILISINDKTMQEQSEVINKQFEDWKGELEQVDDVCVIGVKT